MSNRLPGENADGAARNIPNPLVARRSALLRYALAVCLAWVALAGAAEQAPLHHDIHVRLDPDSRRLEAHGTLVLRPGPAVQLELAARFRVSSIRLGERELDAAGGSAGGLRHWRIPASEAERRITIAWSGELDRSVDHLEHRDTLGRVAPTAGPRGSFLPAAGRWYPSIAGTLESYRLTLDLPVGERGLVAGRLVSERQANGRYNAEFAFDEPSEGIDLMTGPYRIAERMMSSIDARPLRLRSYLHEEIATLSDPYLEAVADYIARYERLIGAYPYAGFSVVSSPTPTGFGMPALTYLGIEVIRLPFIRATSLGHEVLHNWWGNGVYPDFARGNWSEGLTTFMADYAYKEDQGEEAAREMRLGWLSDFAAVPAGQDRPLVSFTSRSHGASQIVGYNKAAMVFFMLRELIGREAFEGGLRRFWQAHRFRVAGWGDLRLAFETESGRNLSGFFEQWLGRTGAPELHIESARAEGNRLRVLLVQAQPAYALRVPVTIATAAGSEQHVVEMNADRVEAALQLQARASSVSLDPDLRLFRRLAAHEAPPTLREAMLDPVTRLVLASPSLAVPARALARRMLENQAQELSPEAGLGTGSLLLVGLHADVDRWLAARALPPRPARSGSPGAEAWAMRAPAGNAIAVVSVADTAALEALLRPLPHYGRQSYVAFEGSRATARSVWPSTPQRLSVE